MTKDRVGAGLAVLAAIIGLVLVFQFPQAEPGGDDDDDGAETSQVVPAVPAPGQPAPAPGQVQQPAPGGQVQPAPGQPEQPGDADGDDDDDDG
ncbi:hypothetical protein [Actinomycetospora aeridis]|uniref:Small secreted hydrophilic protein n=1 Tax=Actinomycetospora aeridis TaxID=3129231 RepID=A0ABU8MYE4_9PSEU